MICGPSFSPDHFISKIMKHLLYILCKWIAIDFTIEIYRKIRRNDIISGQKLKARI